MGQAKIISGGPTGLYNIQLQFDIAKVVTRLVTINARLTALIPLIAAAVTAVSVAEAALSQAQSELEAAVTPEEKTAAMSQVLSATSTLTMSRRILGGLNTEQTALEKNKSLLQSVSATETRDDIWCADLTENMPAGKDVGTIEVNGEDSKILIMPAGSAGLGKLQPAQASCPSGVFYNLALKACWQKWKPTYRVGQIKTISYILNTCSVCVDAVFSSVQGLAVNQTGVDCSQALGALYSGFTAFAAANPNHPMITNTGDATITMSEQLTRDLDEVNRYVNTTHPYKQEADKLDKWNFLSPGSPGDCEDMALTKLQMLLDKGYPIGALKFEAGETTKGTGHGWLTVITSEGEKCLDINYQNVMPSSGLNYTNRSKLTGTQWKRSGVLFSNVPVEYMAGDNAQAFEVGDRVVVSFTGQNWTAPKVIGFEANPRGAGIVYQQEDGVIRLCNLRTGAIKYTVSPHVPYGNAYSYMDVHANELYLSYMDLAAGYDAYVDVLDAATGAWKRRISTDIVPSGLDLTMFRVGGIKIDSSGNIWLSAWFLTSSLVNYAGFWGFNQSGVKIASQDQHGYGPAVLDWDRPGQIAIWEGPAGDVTYVCDKTLDRIKQFKTSNISNQKIYSVGNHPIGIAVDGVKCYVLTQHSTSFALALMTYGIDSAGDLAYESSVSLFTPDVTYDEINFRQQSLWISGGTAAGVDTIYRYNRDGTLFSAVDLPARAYGGGFRFINI